MITVDRKFRKPTSNRYGKWLIWPALLFMGITYSVLWKFRTHVPSLLTVAKQVASKEQFYGEPFAWLSNEEYVCFGADGRTLCRCRLSTGVSTPLLSKLGAQWEGVDVQVSPDGKWLFWVEQTGPPHVARTAQLMYNGPVYFRSYVTRLADRHTRQLYELDEGQWEPDSRHLIGIGPASEGANESTLAIRDVLTNDVPLKVPFAPHVSFTRGNTIIVASDRLLGFAIRNTFASGFDENSPIEMIEYGLDKTLHITRRWAVKIPYHTILREAKISPRGDQIAWLVSVEYVDPGLAALHRLVPFVKAPSEARQELWISRLDGTGMRVIGETPTKDSYGITLFVGDIRWLPDGNHLSFSYDGALWTVPVNR